ncbi:MAG: DUF2341 domain-containing protein [Rhodospirillales bacterium]|nr:DUF2341 domain-containing protein [Rhodospirillales bacterium]MCB9994852.1 DUF2341 domain-containing protein [Rhodospirillales bacterium]
MNRFILTVEASVDLTAGPDPLLEILVDAAVVSSATITAQTGVGSDLLIFTLDYTGNFPTSLAFRFNSGSGDGDETVTIESVRINGQALNLGSDLTGVLLAQGASQSVVSTAAHDHLFGRVEPTQPDLGTPTQTGTGAGESIDGTNGQDIIDGGGGDDRIRGIGDDDAINGGSGNDTIFGEDGNDIIIGGAGNDKIHGNAGDDLLYGQDDDDFLFGGDGNDVLNGGLGNDVLIGENGDDIMYGEDGDDRLIGKTGTNTMYGDAGNDTLLGGNGDDTMYGGTENDVLHGGQGNDSIYGEDGDDFITGGDGSDVIDGGIGIDQAFGGNGNDNISGGNGDDQLFGDAGIDTLNGDAGNDTLVGGVGADTITGGVGNDLLFGNGLDPYAISAILRNNPGTAFSKETNSFYQLISSAVTADTAFDASATTQLNGVNGHLVTINSAAENTFVQNLAAGNEIWIGATDSGTEGEWRWESGPESGLQFWSGAAAGSPVNSLYNNWNGGEPNDWNTGEDHAVLRADGLWNDLEGSNTRYYVIEWDASLYSDDNAADNLSGNNDNDMIFGNGGNDIINGDAGDDALFGGAGNDTINGGSENDVIFGGAGNDTLNGDAGNDTIYATNIWFDSDWAYRQNITVDSSITPNDLTDFTILIDGSGFGANFWSNVKADGSDIVVTAGDGTTALDREVTSINTGAQTLELYVKVPTVSANVDTELKIYYGNASISLNNDASTWRSEYTGVWHMEDDLSSGTTIADSSLGASDGQARQGLTAADAVNAQIGQGFQFNNSEYVALDHSFAGTGTMSAISAGGWINTTFSGGAYNDNWSLIDFDRSEFFNVYIDGGTGQLAFSTNAGGIHDMSAGPAVNDGNWHYVMAVYDGTDKILYVDGAEVARTVNAHGGAALGSNLTRYGFIGDGSEADVFDGGRNNIYYTGQFDEIRLYEGVMSADQIAADYNNHFNPSGYITVGSAFETNTAGNDTDVLNGGSGDDVLYASGGNDTLNGDAGNDTLYASHNGNDTLNGGADNDTLYGNEGNNTLHGDAGDDVIYADNGSVAAAASGNPLAAIILADNPDAYWQLTETAGTTADNQGAGGASIDGTYTNGPILNQTALYAGGGSSVHFDGANDFISVPNSALINTAAVTERTVELVFNADTTAGRQVLWEEGGGTNALTIYIDSGQIYFNVRDSGEYGPFTINTAINAGQTYHAAIVFDSVTDGQVHGYLDGALVGSGATATDLDAHSGAIGIGAMNNANYYHDGAQSGNGNYFQGYMSDVALYNVALLQSDIQERSDAIHGILPGPPPAIDDVLYGGDGFDQLYGGSGRDSFVFESASAFNDVDEINNFNLSEYDALDISDLLVGFTPGVSDITEWVQITDSGSDAIVSVDANGLVSGSTYLDIAQINGLNGLDPTTMETNGQLITS